MRQVAWGYVLRNNELLIATRFKPDDPHRAGQLVFPGGGLNKDESYFDCARREVCEETGIWTTYDHKRKLYFNPINIETPLVRGSVDDHGNIQLTYTDSGKQYIGRLISLIPEIKTHEPSEQKTSDAREPRYILLNEAFRTRNQFTPACQILLDIIREQS